MQSQQSLTEKLLRFGTGARVYVFLLVLLLLFDSCCCCCCFIEFLFTFDSHLIFCCTFSPLRFGRRRCNLMQFVLFYVSLFLFLFLSFSWTCCRFSFVRWFVSGFSFLPCTFVFLLFFLFFFFFYFMQFNILFSHLILRVFLLFWKFVFNFKPMRGMCFATFIFTVRRTSLHFYSVLLYYPYALSLIDSRFYIFNLHLYDALKKQYFFFMLFALRSYSASVCIFNCFVSNIHWHTLTIAK